MYLCICRMDLPEKQYCQSCGMPLRFDVEAWLGTNADHSLSNEYCYYCLKDGQYTVEVSMENMIDIWVKYTDKYNDYSSTNYTPGELRTVLNKRLPTLKRWKQKAETRNIHQEAINRITGYIDQNLFRETDTESLARMAHLSLFHFRRVFRTVTGENVGFYIQRLRLEYVAHLLIVTDQSISEILDQTNYRTKFSLSKAFRKHFGVSMSAYREKYKTAFGVRSESCADPVIRPVIKRINTQWVLCLPVGDAFQDNYAYVLLWEKLTRYAREQLHAGSAGRFVSISRDNPAITSPEQCRFYIGIPVEESIKPEPGFVLQEIPGGMYAVFCHTGSYSTLPEMYRKIYEDLLPRSGYFQKHPLTFEVYLNTPSKVEIDELETEVYIPIDYKM